MQNQLCKPQFALVIFVIQWKLKMELQRRYAMAMILPHDLEEHLQQIAEREHRSPEDVLRTLLSQYHLEAAQAVDYRPEAVKQRLYARARQHWQRIGDTQRLALTDSQLDEQFWGFDADDIPRVNSEVVSGQPGSLAALAAAAQQAGLAFEPPPKIGADWEEDFAAHLLRYRQDTHAE
jgi:predicted transcriptional regulator